MNTAPVETAARRPPSRVPLSPMAAVLLAISFGLCGGYLDLGIILFKRYCLNEEGYFRTARDFPWTVTAGHAVLLMVPGLVVAAMNRPRRKLVSLRGGVAVRDARDLGGPAEVAAVRGMQPGPGRRVGPADRHRGRGP